MLLIFAGYGDIEKSALSLNRQPCTAFSCIVETTNLPLGLNVTEVWNPFHVNADFVHLIPRRVQIVTPP